MNKKHKRRRGKGENQKNQLRGKREEGLFIGLNKLKSRNTWAPELPSDIEISFVASSVPEPQTGIQRRTVECRGQDGERLPFRICMDGQRDTLVPSDIRSCVVSRKCKMSKWTEWRIDNECIIPSSSANTISSDDRKGHVRTQVERDKDTNVADNVHKGFLVDTNDDGGFSTSMIRMIRTRHVERLPQGMGRPCPHFKEYKQGHEEEIMRKDNKNNLPSSFSDDDSTNSRRKTNIKIKQPNTLHQKYNINQKSDMNRRRSFDDDKNTNNENIANRQPITSTTRCRNRYKLVASEWSECKVLIENTPSQPTGGNNGPIQQQMASSSSSSRGSCGGGIRTRNVSCVLAYKNQPIDDSFCIDLKQIHRTESCNVECQDSCPTTSWSEWSTCKPRHCNENYRIQEGGSSGGIGYQKPSIPGTQIRRRSPLLHNKSKYKQEDFDEHNQPKFRHISTYNNNLLQTQYNSAAAAAAHCSHLSESRDCSINSCFSWKVEKKEECFLPSKEQKCGKGTRKLLYTCVDHNGQSASSVTECSKLKLPHHEEACYVKCPNECVVSEWSEWGQCPSACSKRDRRLPLVFRNRTLLAHGVNSTGEPCYPLSSMKICRQESCDVHYWQAGMWSECVASNVTMGCGRGYRTRDVACVLKLGDEEGGGVRVVPEWKCLLLVQPSVSQACEKSCPKNCQVTEWSEWTSCRQNCDEDSFNMNLASATVIMSTQSRYRNVLTWPTPKSGTTCPTLVERNPCPLLGAPCTKHKWKPQNWSKCVLPPDASCGDGVRVRGLDCYKAGTKLDKSECLKANGQEIVPPQFEKCTIECKSGCEIGLWTSWTTCSPGCPSTRTRQRSVSSSCNSTVMNLSIRSFPSSDTRNKLLKMSENENCPCFEYKSVPNGEWSQCILESSSTSTSSQQSQSSARKSRFCGIGKRYKRLDCLNSNNQIVDIKLCGGKIYDEESCMLACPMDCHMSSWSDWGLCDTVCGSGLKNRTSKVLRLASTRGRPCPGPSVQYNTCSYPCENYSWEASAWSECMLDSQHVNCGPGRRVRTTRCMERSSSDGVSVEVPSQYCDPIEKPTEEDACHLFCSNECVLSEWSTWTSCSHTCPFDKRINVTPDIHGTNMQQGLGYDNRMKEEYQIRNRTILRRPGSLNADKTNACSIHPSFSQPRQGYAPSSPQTSYLLGQQHENLMPLQERRSCKDSEECRTRSTYKWSLTAWSSCLPKNLNADSTCGSGVRRRGVRCIRVTDGRPVRESNCIERNKPQDLQKTCPIECPIDCEVSSWTAWDKSSCSCGPTHYNMTRKRVIITQPSTTGRPCPNTLIEIKPCESTPCYKWIKTPWKCDLQGAVCGIGVASRNVSCATVDNKFSERKRTSQYSTSNFLFLDYNNFHTQNGVGYEPEEKCFNDSEIHLPLNEKQKLIFDLHEEETCLKSCTTDCVLSEWGAWSECRGRCVGVPTVGTKHRFRHILREPLQPQGQCYSKLNESLSCYADACYTYTHRVLDHDQNGFRQIQCVRSDGLVVEENLCLQSHHYGRNSHHRNPHCNPPCEVLHSKCVRDFFGGTRKNSFSCRCLPGFAPTYLPANPLIPSSKHRLVFCQPTMTNGTLQGSASVSGGAGINGFITHNATVPFKYYPEPSDHLNHWMLAMIGIGCVFIAFVGVSIYLMCKSTNHTPSRIPKDQN